MGTHIQPKEISIVKPARFTDRNQFYLVLGRSVEDYERLRGNAAWTRCQLREIAKSVAIAKGLGCGSRRVDDSIADAICAMARDDKPYEESIRAADTAWEAYLKHH